MMYPVSIPLGRVLDALGEIDKQLAEEVRADGCPRCEGRLHSATWQRKPRGAPDKLLDGCSTRWGLCCADCRRRTLPPSVVFLGRHVYVKAVILLVVAARQRGLSASSLRELRRLYGVSRQTIRRWVTAFLERLPASAGWIQRRGRLSAEVRDRDIPAALLDLLFGRGETVEDVLISACRFLPAL